jgi:DNA polymerase I-like protein with 3'-5' exonuclease and polymerase domains
VEAKEDVGGAKAGITAYRVRTAKLDGATVSWQEDRCTSITRHREQTFDLNNIRNVDTIYTPDKIRIDETPAHTAMGASWQVSFTEVTTDAANMTTTVAKTETWTVEAVAESVTVPAGTFTALRLRKTTSGAADKMYWFVQGVGKVKETGDQTEELVSYTLP